MGKVRPRQDEVRFHCEACSHRWSGAPGRVEDVPDKSHHPWDYYAECPRCGEEARQDRRDAALLKAWANSTGPRTPEGKARSAANLEGHPTPEEARRTRFNALKHGMSAETARFFPARPGQYPDCDGCPYLEDCYPGDACQRRTELFMRHEIAFSSGDPGLLQQLRARTHAVVYAILELIQIDILKRGVALETPAWYYDKDGGFHLAEVVGDGDGAVRARDLDDLDEGERRLIMEVREHPLLKRMSEIIKATGMTLSDSGMTVAGQEQQDALRGFLESEGEDRETLLEYQKRQTDTMDKLGALIDRAQQRAARDPVLVGHDTDAD